MDFVWNDGGRSASGFVGSCGDCVTRAIAIATGRAYRDVYSEIGVATQKSPRNGVPTQAAVKYLADIGWEHVQTDAFLFNVDMLPKGAVIVQLRDRAGRSRHFCAVVDRVIHDTWNPVEDERYYVCGFWVAPVRPHATSKLPSVSPARRVSRQQELTQKEFETILRRLRALDNTANNDASTEGEKRNALRMMQSLMLTHNLSREDIIDKNVDHVLFTRIACPVNGRRACGWEKSLAFYVVHEVFPSVQYYIGTKGHRTLFWFYGPLCDVENCLALFRELLLTIATAARLRYGSYARGSGASYAEGYVAGLPRLTSSTQSPTADRTGQTSAAESAANSHSLILARTLALRKASLAWLADECGVTLTTTRHAGRYMRDSAAEEQGRRHGAKHEIQVSGRRPRITQQ